MAFKTKNFYEDLTLIVEAEELSVHSHNHDPAVLTTAEDEQSGFLAGQATNKQYT